MPPRDFDKSYLYLFQYTDILHERLLCAIKNVLWLEVIKILVKYERVSPTNITA